MWYSCETLALSRGCGLFLLLPKKPRPRDKASETPLESCFPVSLNMTCICGAFMEHFADCQIVDVYHYSVVTGPMIYNYRNESSTWKDGI